jgi:hypothetical protein
VPLGHPTVDFTVTELHDDARRDQLRLCIEDWVKLDAENIVRRRMGLAYAYGLMEWTTNVPPCFTRTGERSTAKFRDAQATVGPRRCRV